MHPEIMVPLVSLRKELEFVKARIDATAALVMKEAGRSIAYKVGTMIELPRAALQARKIAESAEFFSFGTNDLTRPPMASAVMTPLASCLTTCGPV